MSFKFLQLMNYMLGAYLFIRPTQHPNLQSLVPIFPLKIKLPQAMSIMADENHHGQGHHFLMVTIAAQGQINPARQLACRLAQISKSRVTLATPLYSHRRLFPSSLPSAGEPDTTAEEPPLNPNGSGVVAYAPYSDGFDEGVHMDTVEASLFMQNLISTGSRTLATLVHNFAAAGRSITCLLHTIVLTWAADIARGVGIPAIHYWIQPASVFAIYHHYFQGHQGLTSAADAAEKDTLFSIQIPGLPTLRRKDLPSIILSPSPYLSALMDIFIELSKYNKPKVLMNTFYELEAPVINMTTKFELITVGPVTMDKSYTRDLFEEDAGGYMEWLDKQEERSVVYVAFGSLIRLTRRQVEEMDTGLRKSGRPYLWVLRKDSRPKGIGFLVAGKGMVVEWCSQVRVLNHKAVGCFVTHGGWNSTSEAVMSGVPMVMLPQWIVQPVNAWLAGVGWGIVVRVEEVEDGLMEEGELRRSLDVVMGESEKGKEIRRKVEDWKEKARVALSKDGSSSKNLKMFVDEL